VTVLKCSYSPEEPSASAVSHQVGKRRSTTRGRFGRYVPSRGCSLQHRMRAGRYGAMELDQGNRGSARLVGTFLCASNTPSIFNLFLPHSVCSGRLPVSPPLSQADLARADHGFNYDCSRLSRSMNSYPALLPDASLREDVVSRRNMPQLFFYDPLKRGATGAAATTGSGWHV
jgi:hypothetical protein